MATEDTGTEKKKGIFSFLRGVKKSSNDCCCNMKIVPKKEEPAKGSCCNIKIVPDETEKNEKSCCENKDCC